MRVLNSTLAIAIAIIASMTTAPQIAHGEALEIEEVVVTARKIEESLQDVPIAVTSFSGNQLDALGVLETGDIAALTPNFTWNTEFGRATPQPYVRGVGTNNFNPINTGPIGIYQDGVFIGPNIAQAFATFDIERAEVLKGPQGTLYGRNSTGGLVNWISRRPDIGGGTSGYVTVEAGEFDTTNIEAALGFELGDSSAARIAVVRNKNDGTFENENPTVSGDANQIDDIAYRVSLTFEPNDRFTGLLNVHYGESTPDTAPFKQIGLFEPIPNGGTLPAPCSTTPAFGANCAALFSDPEIPDIFTTAKNDDFEEVETFGAFFQFSYDLSDTLILNSITAYDEADLARLDDADDTITQLELDHYFDEFTFYSQELRLDNQGENVSWQAGLHYYSETNEGFLAFTNPIFNNGEANAHEIDTLSYAVFGNVNWSLSEKIRLGVGLRWTYEEKDVQRYDVFQMQTGNNAILSSLQDPRVLRNTIASGTTGARDFDEVTGRISIDYTTDDGNLIYASYARGFKGGDVVGSGLIFEFDGVDDARAQGAIDVLRAQTGIVDPETVDAFEIGFKGDFLDGKLRFNAAAFYYIYSDQQQTVLQPDPTGVAPVGITTLSNAAESKTPGFEAEVIYTPTERWYLQATLGLLDPEYDEFGNPLIGGEDFSGNQVPLTPEWEWSAIARYFLPLKSGAGVSFQVSASGKGSTFFQAQNDINNDLLQEGSVNLLNARIAYTTADERWTIAAFGKNITDEEYFGSGFDVSGLGWVAVKPGAQQYFGAEVSFTFGG